MLAWKIGNGDKVFLGMDLWTGSSISHMLSSDLIDWIRDKGISRIAHIHNLVQTMLCVRTLITTTPTTLPAIPTSSSLM